MKWGLLVVFVMILTKPSIFNKTNIYIHEPSSLNVYSVPHHLQSKHKLQQVYGGVTLKREGLCLRQRWVRWVTRGCYSYLSCKGLAQVFRTYFRFSDSKLAQEINTVDKERELKKLKTGARSNLRRGKQTVLVC